ncbi:MAG: aminotransferase class I/II-fold pyridoxal phosphate-dependent enzyme [Gemmatales bacterium]|nr:aminotransferase class I/II-fold pyridoxal phosphate-dependent enzyme [Gemmatales bacterium]MDW8387359.1 aminotransferase class I/II-fold pyridoxal phosphate-dependent enzyme [Gemmatales bacterium]
MVQLSRFAETLKVETAFDVLAVAKKLKATGKDVVELQIGDSPFPSTRSALEAGIRAIRDGHTHYCPSPGWPSFRETIAETYSREFGVRIGPENVVVTPGAKVVEQFFCEAVLDPGDSVLVFSPHFPTYGPNIERRQARAWYVPLRQENQFRPEPEQVERFLREAPRPKAVFLNSPHNPTGGVASADDLRRIADLIRGRNVALFSDEPYCHMVWEGRHCTPLEFDGMLEQCVAAYTFSKSYSMSGWRVGYAVTSARLADVLGKMINTSLSCVPPIMQLAGQAALLHDAAERDEVMQRFRRKVHLLVEELRKVPEVRIIPPAGTFYVFPDVSAVCRRLGIQSHGLAMYLLEGADDRFGVACLGGECFGEAGRGFLRFSCAEPDERLIQAVQFFADAIHRTDRVAHYLQAHPRYRLAEAA